MKKKLISMLLSAVMLTVAIPSYSYAEKDYGETNIDNQTVYNAEQEQNIFEISQTSDRLITDNDNVLYEAENGLITADGTMVQNEDDKLADGINTDFPDDMEKPEVIHIDEKIDFNFEIEASQISLFSMEKDLFDCGTDYAYQDFVKRSNPEGRQAFYNKLLEINKAFSTDTQDVPETEYGHIISEIDISGYNLTENEIAEVFLMYRQDHPEYYWIPNYYLEVKELNTIYLPIYDEYTLGSVRSELKTTMTQTINKYVQAVEGHTTSYEIALILHDAIIDDTDYGYDENGEAYGNEYTYAHNIVGILDNDISTKVVCESYAKTYQLLLNYFGIDNVYIVGDAGESHAWNAVKFDDGNYYLVDATWDDQPLMPKGCIYDYFATDYNKWSSRKPLVSTDSGIAFQYDLPEMSKTEYTPDNFVGDKVGTTWNETIRDILSNNYYELRCEVKINKMNRKEVWVQIYGESNIVNIPETILHNGVTYEITGIKASNSLYGFTQLQEVFLSENIEYIDGAFLGQLPALEKINIPKNLRTLNFKYDNNIEKLPYLAEISLAPENKRFIMENGTLYSADKSILYFRERDAEGETFSLPDTVTSVQDYALAYNENIKKVILNNGLKVIPKGLLYNCSNVINLDIPDTVEDIYYNFIAGTSLKSLTLSESLKNLYNQWSSLGDVVDTFNCDTLEELIITKNNNGFYCNDGVLYQQISPTQNALVKYPSNKNGEDYTIPNNITDIYNGGVFANTKKLLNLYVNDKLNSISTYNMYNSSIQNIFVDSNNSNILSDENGILYNADKTTLLLYPSGKTETSYKVEDGVRYIGSNAFSFNFTLEEIVFPNSLEEIYATAFSQSYNLKKVIFEDGLKKIYNGAFANCTSLEEIILPDTVTYIGENTLNTGAFQDCSSLQKVKLPSNLEGLPFQAFGGCDSLKEITIPKGITYINKTAFLSSGIEKIIFEGNCPNIESTLQIHSNCTIYYYEDATGFENSEFSNKQNFTLIKLKKGENPDSEINALEYLTYTEKSDGTIEITKCLENAYGSLKIPSEINGIAVTSISNKAFYKCVALQRIEIPNSVTIIGSHAFDSCKSINSMTIPNSITKIEDSTFSDCINLENIEISTNMTHIGYNAFKRCLKLKNIVIPCNVTYIGYDAFYGCQELNNVIIADGVTDIGSSAFYGCTSLTNINIPSSVTNIGNNPFANCTNLHINVDENNNNYSSMDGVLFNKDKTIIISYAKDKINSTYTLPNSVTQIEARAFSNCRGLKSINIPNSVTRIGSYSFEYCSGLTEMSIPNSVIRIDSNAFYYCSRLISLNIPNNITKIDNNVFYYCMNITNIEIPNCVTSIGSSAFSGCKALTEITIPYQVTTISSNAFSNCSADLVIKGYTGSKAETFAYDNNITFESIGAMPTATPSPTPTATPSPTPTATPSPTPTATPSPTPTVTPSPTATPSSTPTTTPTPSPTPTVTSSPMPTLTPSPTPTATPSLTPTATPNPTPTDAPANEIEPIGQYTDKIEIQKEIKDDKIVFTVKPSEAIEMSKITMYIAEYADDGRLTGLKLGENITDGNTITITGDLPQMQNYKIMLWDDINSPLIKAITKID